MKQIRLGQDGPIVSAVGYGAMSFTDFYGPAVDDNSLNVLDACADMGITHVDTADVYGMGRSETVIGNWLKTRSRASPFTIATKVGITRDPEHRFNNSPDHLTRSLDASLTRLGVDVIELYYVHRRDTRQTIEEVTETMAGFVKAGKVKAIGFSEIAPSSLRRAHAVHPIAAVQSEYSLSTRAPELGLIQTCAEIGATLVAFSPVGRALLTDRPHQSADLEGMPFMKVNPRFTEPNPSLAIAWVLKQGDHVMAIPGTRNLEHLKELVTGGVMKLGAEDIARIEAVLPLGWAHGDRYNVGQWAGPERYC